MKKTYTVILALCVLIISACEIDGSKPCIEEKPAAAILSDFPDSLKAGDTYDLEIKFVLENSCGEFERFDVSNDEMSFDVKLMTKYEGCNCNLEFTEEVTTYKIDLDFPGVYEFNFWQSDQDFDTRTVHIYP
ncbi:MAG: hypothetical protein HUJ25_12370 [Crocinitomicaceae bacterium]|nr:hypothetical protein [Crocinitomicaceae bacterium]